MHWDNNEVMDKVEAFCVLKELAEKHTKAHQDEVMRLFPQQFLKLIRHKMHAFGQNLYFTCMFADSQIPKPAPTFLTPEATAELNNQTHVIKVLKNVDRTEQKKQSLQQSYLPVCNQLLNCAQLATPRWRLDVRPGALI